MPYFQLFFKGRRHRMSRLLLDEEPLIVLPSLASIVGLNESIFLQQLHYWLQRSPHEFEGYKWVYNTYEGWEEQFPFWSKSTIRRIVTKLEKQELIIPGNFNRSKIDKTKWYRINYEKLEQLQDEQSTAQSDTSTVQNEQSTDEIDSPSVQSEQSICSNWTDDMLNLNRPIPENTTEITSEKKEEVEEEAPELAKLNPFKFFEENGFGAISPYVAEKIKFWIDDLSEELVYEAMKIAVENGSRTWRYVEAILRDWASRKFTSVQQVHAAQLAFREKRLNKQQRKTSSRPVRQEIVPDWLSKQENHDPPHEEYDPDFEEEKKKVMEILKQYKRQDE
jgi:DnaD/phage-associated family protein